MQKQLQKLYIALVNEYVATMVCQCLMYKEPTLPTGSTCICTKGTFLYEATPLTMVEETGPGLDTKTSYCSPPNDSTPTSGPQQKRRQSNVNTVGSSSRRQQARMKCNVGRVDAIVNAHVRRESPEPFKLRSERSNLQATRLIVMCAHLS